MLSRISRVAGSRVLALDYRLAPEFSFPAPVEDAVAAYRWLLRQGKDPKTIVIGGDSAGGGLMVSTLVALRYLGEPMPAAGVGLSPWTDMEATGQSFTDNADRDPMVNREGIHRFAGVYLRGKDPRAPLASPIHADLSGLPPLLLHVGSIECLVSDTTALAERAEKAGVRGRGGGLGGHAPRVAPIRRRAARRSAGHRTRGGIYTQAHRLGPR